MKPRAILFLVVFCLTLGFLAMDGLCTTAKKVSADGKELRLKSENVYPPEDVQAVSSAGKYATGGSKDPADCFNLIPDPEVPAVTEHDIVGTTWYDFQKNGSMGRMISVTTAALGGYRHISWMWTAGVYPGVQRRVYARSKPEAGVWSTQEEVGLGTVNSGYCNQTHLVDGTSVVFFHRTGIGGGYSYMAMADGPAANPLYTRKWDLPDDIFEAPSGEPGAWPKGDVLYVIDSTVYQTGPLNYLHIIETESALEAGALQWIGYLRCYVDPDDVNNLICQTPNEPTYNITADAAFDDDIHAFDNSCDVSGVVATNRYGGHTGARVAIAYLPPTIAGDCDMQADAAYIECTDNGAGWLDGTDWPPTKHVVASYAGANEQAFHDISACYDYDDGLHLVWTTSGFDPANPGTYQPGVARIYHWSKEHGVSTVASKIQEDANPSAHCLNASKVSISPKEYIYHPGGDSSYLFCIWAQVDAFDQSAGGFGNADIFGSGTFDGGNTWGKVLNLTGTKAPGCAAGECLSSHNPSLALNMNAGDLHIEYICDRDAGFAIYDEGVWTENPVMYMRLPEWVVEAGPRGDYRIESPAHWWHPPIKVLPNQTRTITFKVFSIGNEALTYSVSSDNPCVQVSVPPSQLQPKDSVEISVLLDGTGACNGTFIAGNVILSTNEAGGRVENLRVHAVVATDYYECDRDPETVDTLSNICDGKFRYGIRYRRCSNTGWYVEVEFGWMPDTLHSVFFQAGNIIGTTSGADTVVGRFMREDRQMGAQDRLYTEECGGGRDAPYSIVYTKNTFICPNHLPPPSHFKWFWWEEAVQARLFGCTAPDIYSGIVITYSTVRRHDPPGWWPDLTPFTNYEDTYIGVAADIDCPYDTSYLESARNEGGYDAVNHIAWQRGWDYTGAHPEYNDVYAGLALADGGEPGESIIPYGAHCVKNNQYLYPQDGWGWKDGELYGLTSTPGVTIQDPDSLLDRAYVVSGRKIDAGTDPDAEASFTYIAAVSSDGLAGLQEAVDTARAIVARDRASAGLPAKCGDCQGDYVVNVGDIVYLVTYLYKGGPAPFCPLARGDVNNDGVINVGDVVYLVTFAFKQGPEPKCPGLWY